MSFNINNRLAFIDTFQVLGSSFDSLVKNVDKNNFTYLSQKFDSKEIRFSQAKSISSI